MTQATEVESALGTGTSVVVEKCQVCGCDALERILFLGYLPPVNSMPLVGSQPKEEPSYPAELLRCPECTLVQLGLVVDAKLLFPETYPYTSSTTRVLRDNFADLYRETTELVALEAQHLIVDIGSNDGNLLSNFKEHHRVCGVTPEKIGELAVERGIPTIFDYFGPAAVERILHEYGRARVVTATNVFAHIERPHATLEGILQVLDNDGVFISESHYFLDLVKTVQYDTIYHEHLRYYSLHSLRHLLEQHGLEVFHVKPIATHGGSIRVYSARQGLYSVRDSVNELLQVEAEALNKESLLQFRRAVEGSRAKLWAVLAQAKAEGARIMGVSAPSRGSTLISYTGLDDGILEAVVEVKGSHKIGKYIPGTLIPVVEEGVLFGPDQPEYALLLAWHIADELVPKLRELGFRGRFIVPLPEPRVI